MNVEIEELDEHWYRLPLTGRGVREVLLHGTGKRPWITVVLHDDVTLGLHYYKVITLDLKTPVNTHIDAIDDGHIETTITGLGDEMMVIESFDVRLFGEEVEHMCDWIGRKLAREWTDGFGHIVNGVRITLREEKTGAPQKVSDITPRVK
jgi:hypothetical protein